MMSANSPLPPEHFPGVTFDLTDSPDHADISRVEENLTLFNEKGSLAYDKRPLCIFVRNETGRTLGGVTGYTNWGALYLDCFWLPEEIRSIGGAGSHILDMAETEARKRGCFQARLYTYSFQAPAFYIARGYEIFGELPDYPPGHSQIWFKKSLCERNAR